MYLEQNFAIWKAPYCLRHIFLCECGESLPDHQAPLLSQPSTMKPEAWGLHTQCTLSSGSTGAREKNTSSGTNLYVHGGKKIRVTSSDTHLLFHDGDHVGQSSYHLTTV